MSDKNQNQPNDQPNASKIVIKEQFEIVVSGNDIKLGDIKFAHHHIVLFRTKYALHRLLFCA